MNKKYIAIILSVVLVFTSLCFVPKKVYADDAVIGTWTTIGDNGWYYFLNSSSCSSATYSGGESFFDTTIFTLNKFAYKEGDFQIFTSNYTIKKSGEHTFRFRVKDTNSTSASTMHLYVNGGFKERHPSIPTVAGSYTVYEITYNVQAGDVIKLLYHQSWSSPGRKEITASIDGEDETTTQEEVSTTEPVTAEPGFTAPTEVGVYNMSPENLGYKLKCKGPQDAVSYNVYVDDYHMPVANVEKSGDCFEASCLSRFADDQIHRIHITAVQAGTGYESPSSDEVSVRISNPNNQKWNVDDDPTDIPRCYIITNADNDFVKESKTSVSINVFGNDNEVLSCYDGGTIKLRGNSTKYADKKAYNISFDSKQTVLEGANSGKKWCLLASAYDKSMLRNKLAMDLGKVFNDVGSPADQYIDLYIDGTYKGLYEICEPADNGRAGIEYNESLEVPDVQFELENNNRNEMMDGVMYYKTPNTHIRFMCEQWEDLVALKAKEAREKYYDYNETLNYIHYSLLEDESSSLKYSNWVSTLRAFDDALGNPNSNESLSYIDMNSFVDIYLINEIMNTVDFQYSSVKFFINYELVDDEWVPIIHAGCTWDFDLSSGNSSYDYARSYGYLRCQENPWFKKLMQNQTFCNAVKARFQEKYLEVLNLFQNNSVGKNLIDKNIDVISKAVERNYAPESKGGAGWNVAHADGYEMQVQYSYSTIKPYNSFSYKQHIQYLKHWLKERVEYMSDKWGISYTKTSNDLKITGYQMSANNHDTAGSIGQRTVYQFEPSIGGKVPTERGLVYGLVYGENPISPEDVLVGSSSPYVHSYAATESGKLNEKMGDSDTADYYAMTMLSGSSLSSDAFLSKYYVRAYAKMSDGTYVYSDVESFTVFDITNYLYTNNLVLNKSTFDYLYSKVLKVCDSEYETREYEWGNTIVRY